jgi:hypothetical protein
MQGIARIRARFPTAPADRDGNRDHPPVSKSSYAHQRQVRANAQVPPVTLTRTSVVLPWLLSQ